MRKYTDGFYDVSGQLKITKFIMIKHNSFYKRDVSYAKIQLT